MNQDIAQIVHTLTYKPLGRVDTFRKLPLPEQGAVFVQLSHYLQQAVLAQLPLLEAVDLLDQMDLQAAEAVLTRMKDHRRRTKITKRLKSDIREKVDYFLRFHPKATLSLVHFNYLFLSESTTIGQAADAIEAHYQETGRFPEILVHKNGELCGEVPIGTLVRERNSLTLSKFVIPVGTITYRAEVSEIVDVLTNSKRNKVVVVDNDESVLGIIYAADAMELFGNMPAESLYSFTGVDSSERPFDGVLQKFKNRYKWLVLNLATAFLAGSVILSFQDTINSLTILSVYIPIVAGMGGNAAAQTFAVMLRGLTLGTVSWRTGKAAIIKETSAGFLNGVVIGLIVSVISIAIEGNPYLGLVVGLTMIAQHMVAALAGSVIPLFLKHLGRDPASVSTIFITTVTDVMGISLLLGLGTLILL